METRRVGFNQSVPTASAIKMQTRLKQIADELTSLLLKSIVAAFLIVTSTARADALGDGCNLIIAGNLDEALSALRTAALVLNEAPTNNLEHEFMVVSAAGSAKALEFLVEDSKAGKFPVQDWQGKCRGSAGFPTRATSAWGKQAPIAALESFFKSGDCVPC